MHPYTHTYTHNITHICTDTHIRVPIHTYVQRESRDQLPAPSPFEASDAAAAVTDTPVYRDPPVTAKVQKIAQRPFAAGKSQKPLAKTDVRKNELADVDAIPARAQNGHFRIRKMSAIKKVRGRILDFSECQ